jgi:hypothetical protein
MTTLAPAAFSSAPLIPMIYSTVPVGGTSDVPLQVTSSRSGSMDAPVQFSLVQVGVSIVPEKIRC